MAHSCPDCGYLCHCGGDIDDCEFDNTPEQRACLHCDYLRDDDDSVYDAGWDSWEDAQETERS